MTRNELKNDAKWAIINKLEEGYDGYLCDLHNEVFNMEMYEPYIDRAVEILDELGGHSVIAEVIKYEQDEFGEVSANKYNNPCWVLSMLWYIVGEEALSELGEDIEEFDELWNEELTEAECLMLIAKFKERVYLEC